jgi:peptide/nickel transport system substrate-binding protein
VLHITAPVLALVWLLAVAANALAQKPGGVLRIYHRDNLPSASSHEESTVSTVAPFMGVFNNLVLFDASKPLNRPATIVGDLAESWTWDARGTRLTFKLHQGVKWHDGKPSTAKDVQCTFNKLTGKDPEEFRKNPRAIWWQNLDEVLVNGGGRSPPSSSCWPRARRPSTRAACRPRTCAPIPLAPDPSSSRNSAVARP